TPMKVDPLSEEKIKNYFITREMPMSKLNLKQALKPEGAITLENPVGTAPGIIWDVSHHAGKPLHVFTFPGVPKELYTMWPQVKKTLKRLQLEHAQSNPVLITQFLSFFGVGESKLAELLQDLMKADKVTVAPYVGNAVVRIRVAAKADTEAEAHQLIEPVASEIKQRCAPYYIGQNEETLEGVVAKRLIELGLTVSVAESCTGGLVSSRLTDVSGSSAYTTLNVVTYSNEQKMALLDVEKQTLETHGAVSAEVAKQMAEGILKLSGSHIGLSLTGIAGPTGGSKEKPVGLVHIGLSSPGFLPESLKIKLPPLSITKKVMVNRNYSREDIKYWFSQYALHLLHQYLNPHLGAMKEFG
ncbi:MAG: nicotinamide-nucleotide amidohydrolase family protein, partial [Cyanobacteria bacterium]|nr:nicotinamide-nucleotide amidohydrolase family protein [Cyanobacteriota bacterium]